MLQLSLIDLVVLGGVAVVLPGALGGPWRWWALSTIAVAASFTLDRGAGAGLLVIPWLLTGAVVAGRALREAGPLLFWDLDVVAGLSAHGWGLVAAGALLTSRLGLALLGVHEPIVELTAVHYTYAGVGALTLAVMAHRTAVTPGARRVGRAAVTITMAAPPIVAFGFATGVAVPQVGGAVLMAVGVWLTACLELARVVGHRASGWTRAFLGISALAIWVPMVLAVAWAAGQHWAIPVLSISDMARTHGLANAVGFILCGLIARYLDERQETTWS